MKKHDLILRIIGGIAVVMAAEGFWYNLSTLRAVLANRDFDPGTPHFFPAFVVMSAICIVCYILLTVTGIEFIRGRSRLARLFSCTLIFEIVYHMGVGSLWFAPIIGTSIAAATGVANGGLVLQGICLFPFWAPFVVEWARLRQEESSNNALYVNGRPQLAAAGQTSSNLERFMVKRVIFIWLWTLAFIVGSKSFGFFAIALYSARTISSGSPPTHETISHIVPWVLMPSGVLGSVGLVLGVLGRLPGTRKSYVRADLQVVESERSRGPSPPQSTDNEAR